MSDREEARRKAWNFGFAANVPHNRALGMVIEDIGDNWARIALPYDARFVGNPETGVLHGGVITALLDATSGAAVFTSLEKMQPIATAAGTFMVATATGRESKKLHPERP